MTRNIDFDEFAKAVNASGLGSEAGVDVVKDWESVPLTHSSGVTPKDWERVQKALDSE